MHSINKISDKQSFVIETDSLSAPKRTFPVARFPFPVKDAGTRGACSLNHKSLFMRLGAPWRMSDCPQNRSAGSGGASGNNQHFHASSSMPPAREELPFGIFFH
jgi:hypothetical protein